MKIRLARNLTRIQLGLECLDFGILGYRRLLHLAGNLRLGKLDRIAHVLLGQFKALMQLLLKSAVAYLLQGVGVASLVDFECFAVVGVDDFEHGNWPLILDWMCGCQDAPRPML